ncbi:MAG: hypothetical protein ACQEWG_11475 [Bacteroidota bacterium]
MKYKKIREEELKNKVGVDWFKHFDTTEIIGNIDFTVFPKQDSLFGRTPLLWAEAKTGNFDIPTMFVQLILTIGRARTFDKTLPPAFLGAFDFKKIAFVPYLSVQDIFFLNDFNWNVTPSNQKTKEFNLIKERVDATLKKTTYVYDYEKDKKDLITFIKNNVAKATTVSKIKIDKNNFIPIYLRWLEIIKPIIDVNWDDLKKANISDSDFYLADIFVDDKGTQNIDDDLTIRNNLFVVFQNQGYKIAKENIKQMFDATINIKIKETYQQFWKRYKRPPIEEFQDYILARRDLLAPQDIRERKGAFFTPRHWVELSQKYITEYLGEDWQDDYYIWDCAAGTGNLLAGLTNKYNIYASTIDQADVNVMHERVEHGANLLDSHVFQFDFLNDEFTQLPQSLQDILNDEVKRKKLIIYINPPYAEGDNRNGEGRSGVATSLIHKKYDKVMGYAKREMYIQFLARIYFEIPNCIVGEFSTLTGLTGSKFSAFRNFFKAKMESIFIVPANTFDNVKGNFPIGFKIWNTDKKEEFKFIQTDIYDKKEIFIGVKSIYAYNDEKYINDWTLTFVDNNSESMATIIGIANDFQNQNTVRIEMPNKPWNHQYQWQITRNNLIESCIYFTVRKCIKHNWMIHNDQFLSPQEDWKNDTEFQNDCLAYALFDGKNLFKSKFGMNNWIPFTEQEVDSKEKFQSNFMSNFINGKLKAEKQTEDLLFDNNSASGVYDNKLRNLSNEAKVVFKAGLELWKYYHLQKDINTNASLYDIREYFQGRNDIGRMNNKSADESYTNLISDLRLKLNMLADKITPKIYEYKFLK